jgi:hypothetical protein
MENTADFTHKELCLLLSAICENELGVILAKNINDARKKVNLFEYDDTIHTTRIQNKQGKTRVSVFQTNYERGCGNWGHVYTTTI